MKRQREHNFSETELSTEISMFKHVWKTMLLRVKNV